MEQSLSKPPSAAWFHAKGRVIDCGERPLIMGIVNVTPDSFYDGGRYADPDAAVAHGVALAGEGADILDVGAESTRPGASPISEQEEIDRLMPVVAALARRVGVPLSVDTTKARVAELAIEAGASIINDVSALRFDAGMAPVIARSRAAVVLMHMQGTPQTMQVAPQYGDVVGEIKEFFRERMEAAGRAGIPESRIILDPGVGFGKLLVHNLEILAHVSSFAMLNRPLLLGLSRKGFIGQIIDRPAAEREWGTAAAVALAVDRGAQIVRVHDVAMMADVVKVAWAMGRQRSSARQESYA
jgi:dihydropteroate synthase